MKSCIFLLIFSMAIIQIKLILPPQIRQELFNKLTKKISPSDFEQDYTELTSDFSEDFQQMKYNVSDIQALMAKYNLSESFNYISQTGAEVIIKNQARCGSCWSFASTSALAYRYKKYGIDINLSPQDGLSCYFPDCDSGNYIIDSLLNLVKNGTVTEQCFPYESSDGKTIPECPSTCKDGSEFKKYHSQNAYTAYNSKQENFYDLVILVMDQLVTQGPVVGVFDVYGDFDNFGNDTIKCLNDVYTYDGVSIYRGAHAVTITGYGFLNNKFYWLVQNSWGEKWCDSGFIKMEIGQFLEISFSEPNIPPEQVTPVEIDISLKSLTTDCYLIVNTTSSLDKWSNTLNVKFTHEKEAQNIEFQIGKNKIRGKDEINCNYEISKVYFGRKRGKYIYKEFESLGVENTFKLNSFKGKYFYYYGFDNIEPYKYNQYYITQVGSKIIFKHKYNVNEDSLPPL